MMTRGLLSGNTVASCCFAAVSVLLCSAVVQQHTCRSMPGLNLALLGRSTSGPKAVTSDPGTALLSPFLQINKSRGRHERPRLSELTACNVAYSSSLAHALSAIKSAKG